jgi:hypothetical protein
MICAAASGDPFRRVFDIVIGAMRDHRFTNRSWWAQAAATTAERLEIALQTGRGTSALRPASKPGRSRTSNGRLLVAAACDPSTQAPQAPRYRGDMVDERMPGSDQSGSLDERRTEAAQPVPGLTVSVLTPISGYTTRPGGHSRHVEPSAGPDSDTLARPPPRAFRTPSKGAGHEANF